MKVNDPIKENLQQFKESYYKDFGVTLSDKEAYDALFNLVGFFKVLIKIDRSIKLKRKFKFLKTKS